MTRAFFFAFGFLALGGCATSVDTESSPSGDTGKNTDSVVGDTTLEDSRATDTSVSDTKTGDDTSAVTTRATTPPSPRTPDPPLPDAIGLDIGGGVPCGATTCGPKESCCPYTLTCYATGCLACCSPKFDGGGIDILPPPPDSPAIDTGADKCALVKCASGLICCPATGACYSKLCLACCPSTI